MSASHYQILSELGRGGYATVHRAIDKRTGKECVLKVLDKNTSNPAHAQMFRTEYAILRAIAADGPNRSVVQVLELLETPTPTIVEEFIPGIKLRHHLAAALTLREKLKVMQQITAALAVVHSKGYLYCDLTPDNIMIRDDGSVTLIDFGLARPLRPALASADPALSNLTADTTVRGTVEYMSPEQLRSEPLDVRSDLYSLGVVFYEILTGAPPFHDGTPEDIKLGHLLGAISPPSEVVSGLPDLLSKITAILLQRPRWLRYSVATDVAARLGAVKVTELQAA